MGVLTSDEIVEPRGSRPGPRPGVRARLIKNRVPAKTVASYNIANPIDPVLGHYKQSLIVTTLRKYKGKLSSVATALGVSLLTVQGYVKKSKVLQEILISFNEAELDNAEEKLQKQIEKENLSAIQFYLKCKGKDRGWTEKSEMSIELSKPITFKYTVVKSQDDKKNKKK